MRDESKGSIALYNFNDSQLKIGRFPWMDIVIQRWAHLLETTLFEQLGIVFDIETPLVVWKRFEQFYTDIKRRQPLYIFQTQYQGEGLLVIGNKFAHACLQQSAKKLLKNQPDTIPNLASENQEKLHRILLYMLRDFEKSWTGIADFKLSLIRMTSLRFRAKIMTPLEKCVITRVLLHGHGFSSDMTLCFPYSSLDAIFQKLAKKKILPTPSTDYNYSALQKHFFQIFLEEEYEMVAELGTVEMTPKTTLRIGGVIPLTSYTDKKLAIKINGVPVLFGEVGQTQKNYAVRVLDQPKKEEVCKPPVEFSEIQWPQA